MTQWVRTDWQLLDGERTSAPATIGVTWGRGALDESVEDVGVLGTALGAIRDELSRPIEMEPGVAAVPEVRVSLAQDACSVLIVGNDDVVAATWRRLLTLFTPDSLPPTTTEVAPSLPEWPADVVHRTGANSSPLTSTAIRSEDVRGRAAALLRRMDPSSGHVPRVFFTNRAGLVDLTVPVGAAGTSATWADGTQQWRPQSATRTGSNAPGTLAVAVTQTLLTFMVPNDAAGTEAAGLVRASVRRGFEESGLAVPAFALIGEGFGAGLHITLITQTPITTAERVRVFARAIPRLTLVPDSWFEGGSPSTPGADRVRVARGLAPGDVATPEAVRSALRDAAQSLHLAMDPLELPDSDEAHALLASHPFLVPGSTLVQRKNYCGWRLRGFGADPVTRNNRAWVNGETLATGATSSWHRNATVEWRAADLRRPLVAVEDDAGGLRVVDRSLDVAAFTPKLFRSGEGLRARVEDRLKGVPRLRLEAAASERAVARAKASGVTVFVGLFTIPIVFGVFIAIMAFNQNTGPAGVQDSGSWGSTSKMKNGSTVSVNSPKPTLNPGGGMRYAAEVEFCGGGKSLGKVGDRTVQGSAQNEVSPSDFAALAPGARDIPAAAPSDSGLRASSVKPKECVSGEVVFVDPGGTQENIEIVYTNEAGDGFTWGYGG